MSGVNKVILVGRLGKDPEVRNLENGATVANFTMDSLLNERGKEFIFEGWRRQDLIRFGTFTTGTWWDHVPTNDMNKELMPIPYTTINNNKNLKQNPGY